MTAAPLLCPDCDEPMDPAAAPRHPVHDITDEEWATMRAGEQARAEARRVAKVRADMRRANRRTTKPARRKR